MISHLMVLYIEFVYLKSKKVNIDQVTYLQNSFKNPSKLIPLAIWFADI